MLPNIRWKSTARPGYRKPGRLRARHLLIITTFAIALTWGIACTQFLAQQESQTPEDIVCDHVNAIDEAMLREELTVDEIKDELHKLENEIEPIKGELYDATERFIYALHNILATGSYDYPTLQVLNYLDTYEHMELHVEGFEKLESVRMECDYLHNKWIGDEPAIKIHFSQAGIEDGKYSIEELIEHGEAIFTASFNTLDGAGRPTLDGVSEFRQRREGHHSFNRISGPDANACSGCHNLPAIGGGGDNVANVFSLSQRFEFVDFNNQMEFDHRSELDDRLQYGHEDEDPLTLSNVGNERNTVGMFGSGFVELLAREMTHELLDTEQEAIAEAKKSGWPVRKELYAKGVYFGAITAHPNGFTYTSEVEGVNGDLIVRPFIQKGVTTSLREFTNNALLHHHGIQNYERIEPYTDDDGDGIVNEATPGDVTALVTFMATLPAPIPQQPEDPELAAKVESGRQTFDNIGCARCHIPVLPLESLIFTEPNEFNVGKDLRPSMVDNVLSIDLSKYSEQLETDENGHYLIPVFSDLRRHEMGEELDNEEVVQNGVPTDWWMTKRLWGFASEPPFLHHGRATLISEAIIAHGGEAEPERDRFLALTTEEQDAIIAFLKTLTIPDQD